MVRFINSLFPLPAIKLLNVRYTPLHLFPTLLSLCVFYYCLYMHCVSATFFSEQCIFILCIYFYSTTFYIQMSYILILILHTSQHRLLYTVAKQYHSLYKRSLLSFLFSDNKGSPSYHSPSFMIQLRFWHLSVQFKYISSLKNKNIMLCSIWN